MIIQYFKTKSNKLTNYGPGTIPYKAVNINSIYILNRPLMNFESLKLVSGFSYNR